MPIYNDNGTKIPEGAWKEGKDDTDEDDNDSVIPYEDVVAQLNITGYGVCEFPIDTSSTCNVGNIELNSYNWMAYRVDEYVELLYRKDT